MFARHAFRAFFHQCPRGPPSGARFISPTWRNFSSIRTKAAAKPKPSTPEETLKFAGRRTEGFGRLERKVAREGSINLFQAPSHRSYIGGAYGLAAFCFAYSLYNSNMVFRDPIGNVQIPMWQQTLFGGICVAMSIMGTVFLSKTVRLIKSVNAVSVNGATVLRFKVRSVIPFKKAYEFDALPRQIAFSRRLVVSPGSQVRGQQQQSEMPKPKMSTKDIMKLPAKAISTTIFKIFLSIRKLFTQEDFILLEVEGQKGDFRMDAAGFISEDFLVIGNPVSVKRF